MKDVGLTQLDEFLARLHARARWEQAWSVARRLQHIRIRYALDADTMKAMGILKHRELWNAVERMGRAKSFAPWKSFLQWDRWLRWLEEKGRGKGTFYPDHMMTRGPKGTLP